MNVCIIGAGQSGLVTCKTFVEQGFNVIVLENSHNGLFHNIPEKNILDGHHQDIYQDTVIFQFLNHILLG